MPGNKKYKLFSQSAEGSNATCAFFSSPAGCRNGDSCKFAHVKSEHDPSPAGKNIGPPSVSLDAASCVSSESEPQSQVKLGKVDHDDNPFLLSPGGAPSEPPKTKKNRRGKRSDDHLPFVNPKKKAKTTSQASAATTPSAGLENQKAKSLNSSASPTFLSLNLPVAPFSVPTSKDENEVPSKRANSEEALSDKDDGRRRVDTANLPLPTSTPAGRKWLDTVKATRAHLHYANNYNFDKYKQIDEEAGICSPAAWVKAKPFGSQTDDSLPPVIAIDCEMCETQDPVSGNKNHKALCRISIVDAETKAPLLDTLVKPAWPIIDYRTWINGIKAEDLENVQFTVRHAQAFMMALCSEETVIVGHAVHNDLAAMNMEHHCVVDSAFLFKSKGSETASVSLKDLSINVLKRAMPTVHDSVNDARVALLCLEHYREKNGQVEAIERTLSKKEKPGKSMTYYASRLFVHRIPKTVTDVHLSKMLLVHTDIQPTEVEPLEFGGSHGKTHAIFRSPQHATVAFDTLQGKAEPDPSGRLQKKVFLRNGSYVRIRKMAYEHQKDKKEGRKDGSIATG